MQASLALTALLMGLAGGPHCIAMCGAACGAIGQAAGGRKSALWSFQIGRLLGYSAMGALAAASMQSLQWLSGQSAALRPVLTLIHVSMLALGLVLLFKARQPVWLEVSAHKLWLRLRAWVAAGGHGAPLALGLAWTFLPCGLLYSALLVAALTGQAVQGAAVMALFALGSSVALLAAPWAWLRLRTMGSGDWGVRLAGLALALISARFLWMNLMGHAGH